MENYSRLLDSSPLAIQCRRCGLVESDDYDVVDDNTIQSLHCAGCGTVTFFSVLECPACGAEALFEWERQPASEELRKLTCAACERRYFDEAAGTSLLP